LEEENPLEHKEHLDEMQEFHKGWLRYLALSTALIAVIAALSSLQSGTYANQSLLEKNNAILAQSQASDQWNFYQAKGIKKRSPNWDMIQHRLSIDTPGNKKPSRSRLNHSKKK
jgi:hypothetical protein